MSNEIRWSDRNCCQTRPKHQNRCIKRLTEVVQISLKDVDISDVATSAVAVARSRVAGAARAVAVTRAMDFALDDDAVAVVAVVSVHEECEDAGDEEEDDVPVSLLVTCY